MYVCRLIAVDKSLTFWALNLPFVKKKSAVCVFVKIRLRILTVCFFFSKKAVRFR